MVVSGDTEVGIRFPHGKVGEERGIQAGVILRTGVDDAVGDVLSCLSGGVDGAADGGYFMKLGRAPDTIVILIVVVGEK